MKPQDVNPKNFKIIHLLYESTDFTIAYGEWESEQNCLSMRWNGVDDKDPGFPSMIGNPIWYILPEELILPVTKSLIETNHCDKLNTLLVLRRTLNFYNNYIDEPKIESNHDNQKPQYLVEIFKFSDTCKGVSVSQGKFATKEEAMKNISWMPGSWTEITDLTTEIVIYNDKQKMSEVYHYYRTREEKRNKDVI